MASPAASLVSDGRGLVLPPSPEGKHLTGLYVNYLQQCLADYRGLGERLEASWRGPWQTSLGWLQLAARRDPKALLHAFAAPSIGTPLQCNYLREALPEFGTKIHEAVQGVVPAVLLELWVRGLVPSDQKLVVPVGPTGIPSFPLNGVLRAPEGVRALELDAREIRAVGAPGCALRRGTEGTAAQLLGGMTLETTYLPAGGVTRFARIDFNPIAVFEAHPDKEGNQLDLGTRPPEEWCESLDEAFALIRTYWPELFAEMRVLLQQVVPVGYDEQRHLSASYREAIGTVYLTLHPQLMTMAEALVHEFQHNKINLAAYGEDFLHNAFEPRYKSPVRPDPRPLWGILLAVHAFLPVAAMYRAMRDKGHPRAKAPDFRRRLAEIDLKNHEGMNMLRLHGDFTPAGKAIMAELTAIEEKHLAEWRAAGLSTEPQEVHLS